MEKLSIQTVKDRLKEIIANDLDADIKVEDIPDDISLYEDGIGLDSITIVNFIVIIENRLHVNFESDEINAELFGSINNIAELVASKLAYVNSQ
jgi:acyl carrier protein